MKTLLLIMLAFIAGCEKEQTEKVEYRVYTDVPVGIKVLGSIDDVMTSTNWNNEFVYVGETSLSPDLEVSAYRYYDLSCDDMGTPYNLKEGYITTEIWYRGEKVCSNTIQTPTYENSIGLYVVSTCSYDLP